MCLNKIPTLPDDEGGDGSASASRVQLSRVCISRLFECYITYEPLEMDYKAFLDLVLALEKRTTRESLIYFWRIFDLEGRGSVSAITLSRFVIAYFYRDIQRMLKEESQIDAPDVEDVITEIFDLVGCADRDRGVTFAELEASRQGHVVIAMLTDVHGFWAYDNRESLMHQNDPGFDPSSLHAAAARDLNAQLDSQEDVFL